METPSFTSPLPFLKAIFLLVTGFEKGNDCFTDRYSVGSESPEGCGNSQGGPDGPPPRSCGAVNNIRHRSSFAPAPGPAATGFLSVTSSPVCPRPYAPPLRVTPGPWSHFGLHISHDARLGPAQNSDNYTHLNCFLVPSGPHMFQSFHRVVMEVPSTQIHPPPRLLSTAFKS